MTSASSASLWCFSKRWGDTICASDDHFILTISYNFMRLMKKSFNYCKVKAPPFVRTNSLNVHPAIKVWNRLLTFILSRSKQQSVSAESLQLYYLFSFYIIRQEGSRALEPVKIPRKKTERYMKRWEVQRRKEKQINLNWLFRVRVDTDVEQPYGWSWPWLINLEPHCL